MVTTPSNFTGDALVSAFRSGKFEIDCLEMKLVQHKSDNPIAYAGPGYIMLSEDGNLEFKVYVRDVSNTSALASLDAMTKGVSGKIYAATDFYTLSALDRANNRWVADDLLPQVDRPGLEDVRPIAHGVLSTLRTESGGFAQSARQKFLRLHFFEKLDVACTNISVEEKPTGTVLTRDHARFVALGCDFRVTKADSEIIVEVQSDKVFPPFFETRIIEALQFLLARSLPLRMFVTADGPRQCLELASSVPRSGKPNITVAISEGF